MGLLKNLLLAPVMLPASGLKFVLTEIRDTADRELNDPQAIRREMLELQRRLDAGLISEDVYDSAEAELLAHLNAITQRKELVMQLTQIAERAKAQLATATNLEPLVVSGADKEADGWRLTVEMLELDRIPEAQGVVGAYEVRLSDEGDLVTWHRTGLRRRDETEWSAE